MKRRGTLTAITLCIIVTLFSQGNKNEFFGNLSQAMQRVETFSGDFIQEKEFRELEVKVTSKGTFTYSKNTGIRFDYTSPREMSMAADGKAVKITVDGKTTTYSLKAQNNALTEMARIMGECMQGKLYALNSQYNLLYKASDEEYLITILYKKESPENAFENIVLTFDSKNYALVKIEICERSGYVTTYLFSLQKMVYL
ncbi:MAG: outer membrane lipoprotein carrier protein LolA [Bacteroidales bacterium]|nr:outer membrane lipoprotein carrier protein LolA [Bacteroidales bacterium]